MFNIEIPSESLQQRQQPAPAPTALTGGQQDNGAHVSIIAALSTAFKSSTGENLQNGKIAELLRQNMGQITDLGKQGRLTPAQLRQLIEFAMSGNKDTASGSQTTQASTPAPDPAASPQQGLTAPKTTQPVQAVVNAIAANTGVFKTSSPAPNGTTLTSLTTNFPISQTLNVTNPGPQHYPSATGRPTLSGGFSAGRISGTPAQIARTDDATILGPSDTSNRQKNSVSDQAMRRSIQDLVFSIDPNVKLEPEVEDLLLDIADEFIDSVTNFGCRLAKHRGGDTLEIRDLQLHLERNHNLRIPGFSSDETRISMSQPAIAPTAGTGGPAGKKSAQNQNVTLRSQRLAQVAQAKKEAKLM